MYEIRTDLALEAREKYERDNVEIKGVRLEKEKMYEDIQITTMVIETENGARSMGRPKGNYITIEAASMDDEDEIKWIKEYNLLTGKPVIFAANVAEDDLADDGASNEYVQKVRKYAKEFGSEVFAVCAQIEQEISELDDDEKQMFLEELGVSESGLDKLIKASYSLLGLISYLTSGEDETRAWTIVKGTKAPQAAGKIHTDFERGFIKAEVVAFDALMESGSMLAAKEKGLVRQEGKDYVVADGDVILFKFNV